MKTSLIDYTGIGTEDPSDHAASLLIFTKSTRLNMEPGLFEKIKGMDQEQKTRELRYMANTIPSSWEFVHYTWLIEQVTRGFTHQFVRTRTASFAQQTMRVLDVNGWTFGTGPTVKENLVLKQVYEEGMHDIASKYRIMVDGGAAIEDARGILPTNIHTNIVMSCNLRTFVEMVHKRSSPRVQGEYRDVLEAMKKAVLEVHPWVSLFIDRTFDKAAADMDNEFEKLRSLGSISKEEQVILMKLLDQLRQKQ